MTTFKEVLEKTLPVIERNDTLKERYLNLILDDMIEYDTKLKEYFNPQKVYEEFYLRFKNQLSVLPDSLKFLKIFYYASKNIPLKECVEKLKDEIDIMNGYFKEFLIDDVRKIRENIDISTFVLMNFSINEVKKALEENEILENIVNEIIKWNIKKDFKKVIKWVDDYKYSMGIDEYKELMDCLEVYFGYYDVNIKEEDLKTIKTIYEDEIPF